MSEYSPVAELNQLKAFADGLGRVEFSDGFELAEFGMDAGLHTWSDHPDFVSAFIPFAQATPSGSSYALWRCDDRTDLATLPVVFVGDEGDLYVVACDVREFLQLLAIDSEFLDPASVEEHSEGHEAYLAWLDQNFGLAAPANMDELSTEDKVLNERFRTWARPFVDLDEY
ncbi:hypothetical protein [Actinophytocola sp.]|uniref:hypothetical protein n=1 Tax=Actinophytocola sp. TaxID=1872138 RepID=UPI002ED42DDB